MIKCNGSVIVVHVLHVNIPEREYDIKIGHGFFDGFGGIIRTEFAPRLAAVVTDSNVEPLYLKRLIDSLEKEGIKTASVTVPQGEGSKSLAVLEMLYGRLLDAGITRTDLIIALGGGVVGDLTGFCAATLLRGIPFVQIPTTLLAQVDSSVGGKTAVNLPQGKNLVGAFWQPRLVLIDTDCLLTLDDKTFSDGMAEVIKYGVIFDSDLFKLLESCGNRDGVMEHIDEVVYRCCDLKRSVVEADEHDTGGRMVLNLGHTFGHAIEKAYNYEKYTHGEAVAMGMIMAAALGEAHGICPIGTQERLRKIVRGFGLPEDAPLSGAEIAQAAAVDKKRDGNAINLIIPTKIGEVIIKRVPVEECSKL